jgi:hypothetical protein
MKQFRPPVILLGLLLMLGMKPAGYHPLVLRFQNRVGNQPLRLSEETYLNQFGEPFSVETFKYYISDIRVTGEGQIEESLLNESHLVDEGDSSSLVLHLSSGLSGIRTIRFIVGVDSLANLGGVQTGDLDPMLGMFWTWNTGYVYARLQGESDSAKSPAHRFTWDIGGYKGPSNAVRVISLTVPDQNGQRQDSMINIYVNILKWFDGKQPLRIATSPVCHQPGALAMQIADNYSTMFSVGP